MPLIPMAMHVPSIVLFLHVGEGSTSDQERPTEMNPVDQI